MKLSDSEDKIIAGAAAAIELKEAVRSEVAYSSRSCRPENKNQWGTIGANATACAANCHRLAEAVDKARGFTDDVQRQACDIFALWFNGARIEAVRQIKLLSPWRAAYVSQYFSGLFAKTDFKASDDFKRMLMQGEVE